jgi:hypothetical protein
LAEPVHNSTKSICNRALQAGFNRHDVQLHLLRLGNLVRKRGQQHPAASLQIQSASKLRGIQAAVPDIPIRAVPVRVGHVAIQTDIYADAGVWLRLPAHVVRISACV